MTTDTLLQPVVKEEWLDDILHLQMWAQDVFLFCEQTMGMFPAEPIDALRDKEIPYTDGFGEKRTAKLFDADGQLIWNDLSFYAVDMFKNQGRAEFKHNGTRFTWQQTVILEAYNRALRTFGKDSFDPTKRWITARSGHGIGKCLGKDTQVLMADGSIKLVQDIKIGDKLMGDDSMPRNVLSLASGNEPMYRIKYFDGTYYDVNESHILSLVASQTHGKQKTGDITNVSVREYLKWSDRKKRTNIGYKRAIELPKQKLPIEPYLLGLWLGDGNSKGGKIFNTDREIIDYLRSVGIGKERIDQRTSCWEANIKGLSKRLRACGVFGNKHIPQIYLNASRKQRLELLAGIIDTDGSRTGRQFSVIQKNKKLAEQIKWLAQSVGNHATINAVKKYCYYKGRKREGTYHIVNISRNTEIIPTKVKRKKSVRNGREQRDNLHFGFTVEPLGEGDYYGFTIDGNRLFMLGDFTVTHNTATMSVIAMHFLWCFWGAQIGMTANSEQQVEDIFMKEFFVWKDRLPLFMQKSLIQTSDHIQMEDSEDWFLRAQVARPEKPEALAGLHGEYVLILVDEASGVADKVFEVMKGALTGDNFIVGYWSNPTRNEGEFFDSHKKGSSYTKLHFSSRESPIVKENYISKMEEDYPSTGVEHSDEVKIRVDGEFAGVTEMDEAGWMPLFANMNILFEPERGQIINGGVIGVDPAGGGKDHSVVHIRDSVYLKEVLNERTSQEKDLARKIETIRDAYNCKSNDIGVDAFGIGAKVVANINTKMGESVNALLTDKPREGTEDLFVTFKDELAWKFREWVAKGGIIITNNKNAWLKDLEKIKYKRVRPGRIQLMSKKEFKKEYGFSPDRFDAAIHTFFKDEPTRAVILTKQEIERKENEEFINRMKQTDNRADPFSSM